MFPSLHAMPREFTKQPSENLDYDFDWTDWMPTGDTIASSSVTAVSGISLGIKEQGDYVNNLWTTSSSGKIIKQFVSGGTVNANYKVTCVMTTIEGRIDEAEIVIRVREL